jgi:hypothetical protein
MRSPLFYPLNRGGDVGGEAELQTDVMRFMAILSLCLVAIFALVQSIPLAPAIEPQPKQELTPVATEAVAETAPAKEVPELIPPMPDRAEVQSETVSLSRPRPSPVAAKPVPAPSASVTAPSPVAEVPIQAREAEEVGFTLRFENDAALTRLVERQVVGFYAIGPDNAFRLSIDGETISFWPASTPGQFHEMDGATVPDVVLTAYRRSNGAPDIRWGVTLPSKMSRELNDYLATETGGSLIIAANGDINLGH